MAKRDSYLEFATEQMSVLGDITTRAMFGGHCIYCDGVVFALHADGAIFLKVDDENRAKFEARGLRPFRPFEDKNTVMQYYQAPAEMFENDDDLREWAGSAVEAGRRAAAKKKGKSRRVRAHR